LEISLDLVKKLREKTGAGISDSKKALIAKEGIVLAKSSDDRTEAAIIEVNCETDFVGKSDTFKNLASTVLKAVFSAKSGDVNTILAAKTDAGNTVQQSVDETTASVGEKVEVKRAGYYKSDNGFFCDYNHLGNKIASLIEITGKDADEGIMLGNDLAMQVVAMRPLTIDRDGISKEMAEKEKEIYKISAVNEGKAENIAEKIASNKLEKFYEENCLLEQEFVKEPGKSVKDVIKQVSNLSNSDYKVKTMVRFQLGETIG
jgi:elongation factor Ts